jgi:S-adenosylmethionine:tRNA ribosyltransferase-isomerase
MDLASFDYHLPEELIAQEPLADRAASRMLVLDRTAQRWEDRQFRDLPEYLAPGDCLVLNNSRVIPARLFGQRAGTRSVPIGKNNPKRREFLSGKIEVLLLRPLSPDALEWTALVRPGRKMRIGERIQFGGSLEGEIIARGEFGERTLRFHGVLDIYAALEELGHVPLPPYIKRGDAGLDRERYQTVFAREKGSVAAPTAGLHFTPEVLDACRHRGATIAHVTLHVGLGTFQPLHTDQVEQARLHTEYYRVAPEDAATMRDARRLIAVGTTSVRTVESLLRDAGGMQARSGETDIFIYPAYQFRGVGAMLTNFHLPRTSLILLVAAFAGRDFVLAAYRHAVEQRYRFYSYGDCMLIL